MAALVLPDAEVSREWEGYPDDTILWAQDASLSRYARVDDKGILRICRFSDDGEVVIAQVESPGDPPLGGLYMSPDGRFVAHVHSHMPGRIAGGLRLWKCEDADASVVWEEPKGVRQAAVAFHADGRRLAVGHLDGSISILDLTTKSAPRKLRCPRAPHMLAFNPRDGRLAVACGEAIYILDADKEKVVQSLRLPKIDTWAHGLAWHPGGRIFAATSEDKKIHFWDVETGAQAKPPLEGHPVSGIRVAFNHKGDRLLSCGWDELARLWDTETGRLLLTLPGRAGAQFSPDDSEIGMERTGTKLRIWRIADGRELRVLRRPAADNTETIYGPVLDSDHRVLAAATSNGLAFFDFYSGNLAAFVPLRTNKTTIPVYFDPKCGWITSGKGAATLWPMKAHQTQDNMLHIGPPSIVATSADGGSASPDGRFRAVPQGNRSLLMDRDRPGLTIAFGPQYDVRHSAVSPDGRWVAGCSWFWDGRSKSVRIWDVETRRNVAELPLIGSSQASFSPSGRWLATYTINGTQLWETETWLAGRRYKGTYNWSDDGKLLAVHDELSVIRWVEPDTGREIFRVSGPEAKWYSAACLTRDYAWLIATVSDQRALYVWNLRLMREQLKKLQMDWEWLESVPAEKDIVPRAPIRVSVDPGVFRFGALESDRDAVAAYSVMLALQPISPDAYFERGLAYDRLKQWAKANADYEMFLALVPTTDFRRPEVQLRRAGIFIDRKDFRAAAGALLDAVDAPRELMPWPGRFAFLCNELAWEMVKRPPEAAMAKTILPLTRKAVELEPYNFLFQNTLGVTLYRLGEYEAAIRCLAANVHLSRDYAAFDLYFLAMSYHRQGEAAKALDCFERASAASKSPANFDARERQELADFRAEAEKVLGVSQQ